MAAKSGPDPYRPGISNESSSCPIKGDVKRNSSPLARCRRYCGLGIQPPRVERPLSMSEWSSSGLRSCFASSREAARLSSLPVVSFQCRDGTLRFPKLASMTVAELPTMVLSETQGL
jgi:hypothetical protein